MAEKRERAAEWISTLSRDNRLVISPQVMNEYCSVVMRKLPHVELDELAADIVAMEPWCTAETSAMSTRLGLALLRRYKTSFFDSVLLGSALLSSCRLFLSEDISHGQSIEGLVLINPFLHKPTDLERLVH